MSPKIVVNPTPAQARVLRGLFEFEDMAVYDLPNSWRRWYSIKGAYREEARVAEVFGTPRPSTIKACAREGWLQAYQPDRYSTVMVLNALGREVAENLTEDDLLSKGYGSQTSEGLLRTLAKRHSPPKWAFVSEVRLGPMGGIKYYIDGHPHPVTANQRIDAFAMHCFPSKGFIRVGYEVKVSRGDFLNELKNPDKRIATEMFTNVWYFAAPVGMIKPEELPDGWGLVEVNGDFHRRKVSAPWHEAGNLPLPFIASMFRAINTRESF